MAVDSREVKTVAIASGKGGTGKTTVAVNLAAVHTEGATLLDCDVEEPNVHLFVDAKWESVQRVSVPVPQFDLAKCDRSGNCRRVCRSNAIAVLSSGPLLFPELCNSCGGCILACPNGAISEMERAIGTVRTGMWRHVQLAEGLLDVGETESPSLIEAVHQATPATGLVIIDSPPGTSCPVVASIRGVDYVVLVTEPTPFGLHDLKLAVEMTRRLGLPFGVVVNRAGIGDDRVQVFCSEENVPILQEIPDDRRIAEVYSGGGLIVDELPQYRSLFVQLSGRITTAVENTATKHDNNGHTDPQVKES